ncbi:MAG: TrkA C-terminal domain-containing protein [Candidatus Omnitrophica bacterium]|nr:TrkA C-terminal domain-containing protein [Candidatus Omnitrophota bacterium]
MIALFSFLTIVVLSIIVVRIGAIALELTGLSPEVASFQAQSAFSGVGFTTTESEAIVNHYLRRRIVRLLMLLGGAGITSSIATLVLTFVGEGGKGFALRGTILGGGLLVIFLFARSKYIYNFTKKIIVKALNRYATLRLYDYEEMLGLSKGYTISRITVRENSWLSNRKLRELNLELEGVLILSIYRKVGDEEKFIGAPRGDTEVKSGDVLICYARHDVAKSLSQRVKGIEGDKEHAFCVEKERKLCDVRRVRGGFD